MDISLGIKPRVGFQVEKVVGISSEGSCKVQWAPAWVSRFHLVGCEHLIHEFLQQSEMETVSRLTEGKTPQAIRDLSLLQLDINSSGKICLGPVVRTQTVQEQITKDSMNMSDMKETLKMPRMVESVPCVGFEVEKVVGISNDGSYQVQWAPGWVSRLQMVGCEHLIRDFYQRRLSQLDQEPVTNEVAQSHEPNESADDFSTFGDQWNQCSTMHTPSNIDLKSELLLSESFGDIPSQTDPSDSDFVLSCVDDNIEGRKSLFDTEAIKIEINQQSPEETSALLFMVNDEPDEYDQNNDENGTQTEKSMKRTRVRKEPKESKITVRPHIRQRRLKKGLYSCPLCRKEVQTKGLLIEHFRQHSGYKPYKCQYCHVAYARSCSLKQHLSTNLDGKVYNCLQCDQVYLRKDEYEEHVFSHTGERPFACEFCSAAFTRKRNLVHHYFRVHNHKATQSEMEPLQSELQSEIENETDFVARSQEVVRTHSEVDEIISNNSNPTDARCDASDVVVSPSKTIVCQICSESFQESCNFKEHLLTHSRNKLYSCNQCDKKFSYQGQLRKHVDIHTTKTVHTCSECGKSFPNLNELGRHLRIHSDVKPYNCELCNYSCAQRKQLLRHLATHTGLKPFICDECGKAYSESGNLKRHQRIHAPATM